MLEEVYGKAAVKKTLVYEWYDNNSAWTREKGSKGKVMLEVSVDVQGLVPYQFIVEGCTVKK
jgi:hypothetical protein